MKYGKKLFVVAATALATVALGACGNNGGSSSSNGKTVLTYWQPKFTDVENAWYKKVVKDFNKSQKKIEVKVQFVPQDSWDRKLKAAQAAHNGPDITEIAYNQLAYSASQGKIQALDSYVPKSTWKEFYSNIEDMVAVKGKHYGMPMLVEPSSVLYYRKDLFKKAGLDPNDPPKTWDELLQDAIKLKQGNTYGFVAANNTVELGWSTWGIQASLGTMPINDNWSKATLQTTNYEKFFKIWGELYKNKVIPAQALAGYTDMAPFGQGRTAMQMNGSWGIGSLRTDYKKMIKNTGIAVMPTLDGNQKKPTATLGGWVMTVDGQSKHPKEAAQFLKYAAADKDVSHLKDYFLNVTKLSKFSARKAVDAALAKDPKSKNDEWRNMIVKDVIPYAIPEPIYAFDITSDYATALQSVYTKNVAPKTALATAAKQINTYIKQNNYAGTNPKK